MTIDTLTAWHHIVKSGDVSGLDALLADSVVFHSPIVNTPKVGKAIALDYLSAVLQLSFDKSFRYVKEAINGQVAFLEFQVEIDGLTVNGVDILSWDNDGRIVDVNVMVRPLKAINLVGEKMGAILQKNQ